MQLEPGKHTIEFRFEPKSYYTGEKISLAFSILLVAGLAGAIFVNLRKKKNETPEKVEA
ncbi:hypothetical protein D3C85_1560620 [compost metagenome]